MTPNPPLQGARLRLESLGLRHAEPLRRVADLDCFRYFVGVQPESLAPQDWRAFLHAWRAIPTCVPLVAIRCATGEPLGCSAFFDVRAAHCGLEIGFTWISPPWRGTWVNPEMKLLMLRHAFEELGATRVQLKCDARNEASRAAILKLGAQLEGILRRHGIQRDGTVRDTAMYSIIHQEWPEVRRGLEARLGRLEGR